jgi:hypothetical protein
MVGLLGGLVLGLFMYGEKCVLGVLPGGQEPLP